MSPLSIYFQFSLQHRPTLQILFVFHYLLPHQNKSQLKARNFIYPVYALCVKCLKDDSIPVQLAKLSSINKCDND